MRTALAAAIFVTAAARAAAAPPSPGLQEEALKYAPIIWVANSEPAYPMLPHAYAFDGIDNDCDSLFDLEDPSEVHTEAEGPGISRQASMLLDAEEEQRRHYQDDVVVNGTVVHTHHVSFPSECGESRAFGMPAPGTPPDKYTNEVEPYFGPQARVLFVGPRDRDAVLGWNEHQAAVPSTWDAAIGRRTTLLQYWLYYPFDMGPNPHRHDGEHVSVFVERDEDDHPRVKAVVGAGHESNSVNNALIAGPLDTDPPPNLVLPRNLPDHMPVLVELGKHASAPDVNCNGRFDLGADANIYSESVWGSRDVWAGSAGKTLKVGRFEAWFSFPRNRLRRYLVDGWWEGAEGRKYREACDDLILAEELPRPVGTPILRMPGAATPDEPPPETRSEKGSPLQQAEVTSRIAAMSQQGIDLSPIARKLTRSYELFPLRDLYALHELLASPKCEDDEECAVAIESFFGDPGRKESFWGPRAPQVVRVHAHSARRMKTWAREGGDHLERRDVWKHEAFRKPATDFRMWLFKRLGVGFVSKVEGGNLVSGAVLRIADLVNKDSRIEVYAHFDRNPDDSVGRFYDAGADFFSSRTRFFGAYFGLGYNAELGTKVFASAGLNFYLPNLPQLKLPRDLSFSLYSGINGELFRETSGVRRAEALRFQVGTRVVWGFWGPRHPLAR